MIYIQGFESLGIRSVTSASALEARRNKPSAFDGPFLSVHPCFAFYDQHLVSGQRSWMFGRHQIPPKAPAGSLTQAHHNRDLHSPRLTTGTGRCDALGDTANLFTWALKTALSSSVPMYSCE